MWGSIGVGFPRVNFSLKKKDITQPFLFYKFVLFILLHCSGTLSNFSCHVNNIIKCNGYLGYFNVMLRFTIFILSHIVLYGIILLSSVLGILEYFNVMLHFTIFILFHIVLYGITLLSSVLGTLM